jgi:hypothetical protein
MDPLHFFHFRSSGASARARSQPLTRSAKKDQRKRKTSRSDYKAQVVTHRDGDDFAGSRSPAIEIAVAEMAIVFMWPMTGFDDCRYQRAVRRALK